VTPDGDLDSGSRLYAADAEFALLSEVMYRPAVIRETSSVVAPEDFGNHRYRQVYSLIAGLVSASENPASVTPLTVRAEVKTRRDEQEQNPEGTKWPVKWLDDGELAEVMTSSSGGHWQHAARLVVQAATRRRTVEAAQRTITEAMHAEGDPTLLAQAATDRFAEIRDSHIPPGRLQTRTLREVFDTEDDPYDWVIPQLLEHGDRLVLTGEEGAGKSTFARQVAICAAAGIHPFALTPIPPVKVVVVDAENSERQWRRKARSVAVAAARGGSVDPRDEVHLVCVGGMDLTGAADVAALHRLIDEHEPDLMIVGPLYRMVPKEITNDTDAAPLIAALNSLRDRGPALIMEAHMGHGKSGSGRRDPRPRGSSALLGWPEFGYGILKDADNPEVSVDLVRWREDRDERPWPKTLIRGGAFPWTDERVPLARRRAFAVGGAAANDGWSPADILEGDPDREMESVR